MYYSLGPWECHPKKLSFNSCFIQPKELPFNSCDVQLREVVQLAIVSCLIHTPYNLTSHMIEHIV